MTAAARCSHTFELERQISLETRSAVIREVQRGLLKQPRSLAPWMFYDAHGSRLFERITTLPEYYLTRTERDIFASFAEAIIASAKGGGPGSLRVVELGAGAASKTGILLEAIVHMQGEVVYLPVDISSEALEMARESIASSFEKVRIEPIVANYVTHPPQLEPYHGTTLAMYIGSNIGNYSPQEARTILRNLMSQVKPGDALLLGTDMVKDVPTLVAAYNDKEGVTAAFNLNILHRLNRELGADFDTTRFRHRAVWNQQESRMEMHLESIHDHGVCIPAAEVYIRFAKCETIHTENSYKFTYGAVRALLEDAGFEVEQTWMDRRQWFAVTLARVRGDAPGITSE